MNILIADIYVINRIGLKELLSKHILNARFDEAADCSSVVQKIDTTRYQLIIIDIQIPDTDPFALLAKIKTAQPAANILVFTSLAEEVYAKKCLQLGVQGYLPKTASEADVTEALQCVRNGEQFLSASIRQTFVDEAIKNQSSNPFNRLSVREFQIVLHLLRGDSLISICQSLALEKSTICTHKSRIFNKLKSSNIIHLHELAKVYRVI